LTNSTIATIKAKANTTVTIEDSKLGKLEWVLRPIPAFDLLANFDLFTNLPDAKQLENPAMDAGNVGTIKNSIFPLMKIVLPACSVRPIITVDEEHPGLKDETAIHMRDLPFNVVIALFNEIIKITGLDEKTDDLRKKLQTQTLVKP